MPPSTMSVLHHVACHQLICHALILRSPLQAVVSKDGQRRDCRHTTFQTAMNLTCQPVMYGRPPVGKAFLVFRQTDRGAVMYGRPPVGKAFLVFRQTDRGAVMYTASRCGRWPRALMENADRIPIIAARCYAR